LRGLQPAGARRLRSRLSGIDADLAASGVALPAQGSGCPRESAGGCRGPAVVPRGGQLRPVGLLEGGGGRGGGARCRGGSWRRRRGRTVRGAGTGGSWWRRARPEAPGSPAWATPSEELRGNAVCATGPRQPAKSRSHLTARRPRRRSGWDCGRAARSGRWGVSAWACVATGSDFWQSRSVSAGAAAVLWPEVVRRRAPPQRGGRRARGALRCPPLGEGRAVSSSPQRGLPVPSGCSSARRMARARCAR